jgi:glycolate oxidase FAD binding subunit
MPPHPAATIVLMDQALRQITEHIRAAADSGTPLRFRGGGSKDFYGELPQGEVLDTRPLRGILSYEPSELVVTVNAGTPLHELEAALAERGQCLPFEPPSFGGPATVGGMVASGLAGPARASAGSVRDFVLGTTLVNGRGEVLTFGGQVMKNVAGYDVSRLMAGSMGTLALVVAVSLKVLPVAPAEATLWFEDMDEAAALQKLNHWAGQPLPLSASCWQDGKLWLRLRGARAAVAAAADVLGGVCVDSPAACPWGALREHRAPFFALSDDQCLWRVAVPGTTAPLALGDTLIEWGGGQRWLRAPASQGAAIRAAAARAGGHATLFRAGASQPRTAVFTPLAAPIARIHAALKQQFDPAGVFGPGRLYANL